GPCSSASVAGLYSLNLPSISVPHPLIVPIASRGGPIIPRRRRVVIRRPISVIRSIWISGAAANGGADRTLRGTRRGIPPETDRVGSTRRADRPAGNRGRRGESNQGVAHHVPSACGIHSVQTCFGNTHERGLMAASNHSRHHARFAILAQQKQLTSVPHFRHA